MGAGGYFLEMVLICSDRKQSQRGFSLIEILIASILFLVVALGVLPMFQRAIRTNNSGQDSTDVSNLARSRVEEFMQISFRSDALVVVAGNELVVVDHFLRETKTWVTGPAPTVPVDPDDPPIWERTTTIRDYGVGAVAGDDGMWANAGDDLDTGLIDSAEALPAGTRAVDIHFKEIEVVVEGTRLGGLLGPSRRLVVRALRSM